MNRKAAQFALGKDAPPVPNSFEEKYPTISEWVHRFGWIEIGQDDLSRSLVRALDVGGIIWEGGESYDNMDALFAALEAGVRAWLKENY